MADLKKAKDAVLVDVVRAIEQEADRARQGLERTVASLLEDARRGAEAVKALGALELPQLVSTAEAAEAQDVIFRSYGGGSGDMVSLFRWQLETSSGQVGWGFGDGPQNRKIPTGRYRLLLFMLKLPDDEKADR